MWCMASEQHVLLVRPGGSRAARSSGPRARSNGRARLVAASRRGLGLALGRPAAPARSTRGSATARARRDHLRPARRPTSRRWCAAPRAARTISPRRARQRRGVERARAAARPPACCRPACPAPAGRGTRAAAGRRRAASSPSRGAGCERRRLAPPGAAAPPRPRGASAGDGRRLEQARAAAARPRAPRAPATRPGWPAASGRRASKKSSSDARPARRPAPPPRSPASSSSTGARRAAPRASGARRAGARAGPCGPPCRWASAAAPPAHEGRGTMYSGRRSPQERRAARRRAGRSAGDHDRPPAARPRPSSRTTTTASRTAGWRAQRGLDLPQLDAEAADLDLMVDAAQELQLARPAASAPGRRCGRAAPPGAPERVGHEPLRRQVRPAQIAARQRPRRRCSSSPGDAHRHRLQLRGPARRNCGVGDRPARCSDRPLAGQPPRPTADQIVVSVGP